MLIDELKQQLTKCEHGLLVNLVLANNIYYTKNKKKAIWTGAKNASQCTGWGMPISAAATPGRGKKPLVFYSECSQGNTACRKGNVTCGFVNEVTFTCLALFTGTVWLAALTGSIHYLMTGKVKHWLDHFPEEEKFGSTGVSTKTKV